MTKNTKIIIGVVSGVVLIGGFFVLVAAVIGISYLAAQSPETTTVSSNKNADAPPTTTKKIAENKLYKQADVDNLIKFHEWASQTKFSGDRRKKFETFLDRDFRRDADKARKDTDDLIATHNKIRSEEKNVQEFTRVLIVTAFLEEFRKKPDDTYSQFMLAVYEKRDDDSPDVSDDDKSDKEDVSAEKISYSEGSFDQELVGKWQRNDGSGYIDPTGKTKYKSGAFYNYEFSPDGTVRRSMDKDVLTIMQCQINETKRATGKATVSGDSMTIAFGETNHTSSNSCESADNFEKTLPAETVALRWHLKTEYETTRLCIDEADGEKCYDRKS